MDPLSGFIETVLDFGQQGASDAFSTLKPGLRLTARVLRVAADQRLLLDFGGFRTLARMDQPARPGDVIRLRVADLGPPVHMQVLPPDQAPDRGVLPRIDLARELTPQDRQGLTQLLDRLLVGKALTAGDRDMTGLGRALSGLREAIMPMDLENPSQAIAGVLQAKTQEQGLFFEQKLAQWLSGQLKDLGAETTLMEKGTATAPGTGPTDPAGPSPASAVPKGSPLDWLFEIRDLKAHLLVIKSFFHQQAPARALGLSGKEVDLLQHSVTSLLDHLHQEQDHLIQRSSQSQLYEIISHWMQVAGQDKPLKLKWYYPRKQGGQEGERPQQVSLLLDMDRLGPVRADLKLIGPGLGLTFSVTTREVQLLFENALDQLKTTLETLFPAVESRVDLSAEKIHGFDSADMMVNETGRIDIQI